MVVTYCTATQVSELLQIETFSTTTSPTFNQVEAIINRKEDRIDRKLMHGWREKTQTDLFLDATFVETRNGVRFDLPNYSIKTLSSGSGDKLEVWDGSNYIDFLVSKTEGRDEDYWLDTTLGVLWIRSEVRAAQRKPVRITYRYGESVVPGEIEDLCLYLTAIDVLSMYPRSISFGEDGSSKTLTQDSKMNYFKQEVKDIYNSLSNIGTF